MPWPFFDIERKKYVVMCAVSVVPSCFLPSRTGTCPSAILRSLPFERFKSHQVSDSGVLKPMIMVNPVGLGDDVAINLQQTNPSSHMLLGR